jgi:hypothetical protein
MNSDTILAALLEALLEFLDNRGDISMDSRGVKLVFMRLGFTRLDIEPSVSRLYPDIPALQHALDAYIDQRVQLALAALALPDAGSHDA